MSDASVLKVQGEGRVSATPELIVLGIKVSNKNLDYSSAIAGLNTRTEQVRAAIESAGLKRDDLKTTDFGVQSDYKQDKEYNRTFDGFVARHVVRISFAMEKQLTNNVFRSLSASGSGAEFEISFDVVDRKAVKNRAIAAAVQNARERAEVLAQAAGVSLGKIVDISYGFAEVRISSGRDYCLSSEAPPDFEGPDLDPQDLTAEDNVTITWEIRN